MPSTDSICLLDLLNLLAGCLKPQVKVFTIKGVNQSLPIHMKPKRHCRVKPDLRVGRIRKFKIYRSLECLPQPPKSFPAHPGALLLPQHLQVIKCDFLAPIVSQAQAQLTLESPWNLKSKHLHLSEALQYGEQFRNKRGYCSMPPIWRLSIRYLPWKQAPQILVERLSHSCAHLALGRR